MARSKYVIYLNLSHEQPKPIVAPYSDLIGLSLQPQYDVLATYSFDDSFDLGSITVEDHILDVHETGEEFKTECVKLCDGFLHEKLLDFSAVECNAYPEFHSSEIEQSDVPNDVIDR